MRSFSFQVAHDADEAMKLTTQENGAQFLAGGTTVIDLMKLDVLHPETLININALSGTHGEITANESGLRLGALARMSDAADHPAVVRDYPMIAQSLTLAASAQLRNMASLGGNVLQRTRCAYFRDPSWTACNKRVPGSGCAALTGRNRLHAVLGVSKDCIASYPGDFAVALVALGAEVNLRNGKTSRKILFEDLHRLPENTPDQETTLEAGELITGFDIPPGPWTKRSVYLKIRDRESYEFAVASAAVALQIENGAVREVRIGLGGVATKPWRAKNAESELRGKPLTEASAVKAAEIAFSGAVTHGDNDFKPELGRRTLVRALLHASEIKV